MSGANRHYLPRFFQGYFLSPLSLKYQSYKKKNFEYYLSSIKTGERNRKINHNVGDKKGSYFENSGQELFGINLINEKGLSKIEKEEIEILISLNEHINNKSYDDLILNNFLNKFVKNLYIRSITDMSQLRFTYKSFIEENIISLKKNFFNDISLEKEEEVKKILEEIFVKDTSTYGNEKSNLIKYIYNNFMEENYEINPKLKDFKYCEVINTESDIPLSDIVIFTKVESFKIIEDVNNVDDLWFVLNKNLVIHFSNSKLGETLVEKELYDFIIKNAKDFIITIEELSEKDIKNTEYFNVVYTELHKEVDEIIYNIGKSLFEANVDEYDSIIKKLLISFEK